MDLDVESIRKALQAIVLKGFSEQKLVMEELLLIRLECYLPI